MVSQPAGQPTPFQYECNYLMQFFETIGLMYVMLDMLCMVLSFFLSEVCFCASSVQTWHLTWRTSDIFVRVLLNYFILQINSHFRKVVGKSARDNPERYCGWFWVNCSSKKFERLSLKAMDECLRVLKESNKTRFDSYSVRNTVLITSHITFRDCRAHIFPTTFLGIAVSTPQAPVNGNSSPALYSYFFGWHVGVLQSWISLISWPAKPPGGTIRRTLGKGVCENSLPFLTIEYRNDTVRCGY